MHISDFRLLMLALNWQRAMKISQHDDKTKNKENRLKILLNFIAKPIRRAFAGTSFKSPTWLNFWSNYFGLNKQPSCGVALFSSLSHSEYALWVKARALLDTPSTPARIPCVRSRNLPVRFRTATNLSLCACHLSINPLCDHILPSRASPKIRCAI